MKSRLSDTAADLGNGTIEAAKNIQAHAKSAWDTVQHQTGVAVREGIALARKRPVSTALVACGVGLVAGFFMKRRAQPSIKDTVKPLQSKGLLLGALIACGTFVKRTFFRGSSSTERIGAEVKRAVKKAKRVVRKAGRKSSHSNGTSHSRK